MIDEKIKNTRVFKTVRGEEKDEEEEKEGPMSTNSNIQLIKTFVKYLKEDLVMFVQLQGDRKEPLDKAKECMGMKIDGEKLSGAYVGNKGDTKYNKVQSEAGIECVSCGYVEEGVEGLQLYGR
ncbi:hypothetical protein Tco_0098015 [Tanacetum coccineum]